MDSCQLTGMLGPHAEDVAITGISISPFHPHAFSISISNEIHMWNLDATADPPEQRKEVWIGEPWEVSVQKETQFDVGNSNIKKRLKRKKMTRHERLQFFQEF